MLLFAIVGTIWNTLAIGSTLFVLGALDLFTVDFSLFEIMLFAALISAVDPVAVIAVFEEIRVNEFLFVNVFGEGGKATIKLIGDGTFVSQGGLDDSSLVLDKLNYERITHSASNNIQKGFAAASSGAEDN